MQAFVSSSVPQMFATPAVLPPIDGRHLNSSPARPPAASLTNRLGRSELSFVLENDPQLIRPLITKLCEHVTCFAECGDRTLAEIETALHEALTNSLYHGNLELSSELRENDDNGYWQMASQRRRTAPYAGRRMHVRVVLSRFHVVFSIRDEGPGFDPNTVPDPTAPSRIDKPSGRGLAIMRHCMNRVTFSRSGNQVTLVKRLGTIADVR